jgi:post-segregation antitoxin (ccd killing protein)
VKRFRRKERSRGNVRHPLLGGLNRNTSATKRATKWRDANKDAIAAYNEFVEKLGTFSDDVRSF